MTIWYRVSQYGRPEITAVNVVRETDKFIVLAKDEWNNGERKIHKGEEYHRTFLAARDYLIAKYTREAESHEETARLKRKYASQVLEMEPK